MFVRLESEAGKPYFINPEHVINVFDHENPGLVGLATSNGFIIKVYGTAEKVAAKLADGLKEMRGKLHSRD